MLYSLSQLGENVVVKRPTTVSRDAYNVPVQSWSSTTVGGVICQPVTDAANMAGWRENETKLSYTLHFPKSYQLALKGCKVVVRGEELDVIGDPRPHPYSPLSYGLTVHVGRLDG